MKITIDIPDGKVDNLVELYNQKYQLETPKTNAEQKDFLSKIIQHEHITLLRQMVARQKEEEAKAQILADADIAESSIEAEIKAKQDLKQAAMQADMAKMAPELATETPQE